MRKWKIDMQGQNVRDTAHEHLRSSMFALNNLMGHHNERSCLVLGIVGGLLLGQRGIQTLQIPFLRTARVNSCPFSCTSISCKLTLPNAMSLRARAVGESECMYPLPWLSSGKLPRRASIISRKIKSRKKRYENEPLDCGSKKRA